MQQTPASSPPNSSSNAIGVSVNGSRAWSLDLAVVCTPAGLELRGDEGVLTALPGRQEKGDPEFQIVTP